MDALLFVKVEWTHTGLVFISLFYFSKFSSDVLTWLLLAAVECAAPSERTNAERTGVEKQSYTYRSVIGYKCSKGTLIGQKEIWCTKDGTWNAPPPQCKGQKFTKNTEIFKHSVYEKKHPFLVLSPPHPPHRGYMSASKCAQCLLDGSSQTRVPNWGNHTHRVRPGSCDDGAENHFLQWRSLAP